MRVLVTCVGAYGHLHPLLPLARALEQAGHEVAIATGPDVLHRAEAAGFAAWEAGLSMGEVFRRLAERYPDQEYNRLAPPEILDWYVPHLFGDLLAPAMLDDLGPLVDRWRPDVILHDTWEFAGPIAAAQRGIPSVTHTLGPRFADRIVEATASTLAPLCSACGLEPDPTAGLYRHLCLDITPAGLQPPQKQILHRDTIQPLRPVAPPPLSGEALPEWIERRRDREVPLVYMTLGTNTNTDASMFRRVVEGLGGLDIDVVITIGLGRDLASIKPTADNVRVENYVPQSLLLPHCSAVICHGGAGTTLSALALGLPVLLLPQGADQYVISDLVYASGSGLLLTPQQVTPTTVRSSVLALLHEPPYGAAARRIQHEIATMPGPEETVHRIEEVRSTVGN